jgi:hypothetical protein
MSRRLFINDQEVQFFNVIAKELIQDIVGQTLTYYAVSDQLTNSDDLYGEAINKTVYLPVEINALVRYEAPAQTVTGFSIDTIYSIEIYFLLDELLERGVVPHEGDFVRFGSSFYEVEQLTQPDLVYGQIDHKVQVMAVCRIAREGQFKIASSEGKV